MTDETTRSEDIQHIRDIVAKGRIAVLTTVSSDGALHSRPLALNQDEFDGSIRFLVQDGGGHIADISGNSSVNVSIDSKAGYLSIAGDGSVSTDPAVIDELWSPAAAAWFPDGREDQTIAVLTVAAASAEYWASDEPGVFALAKVVRGIFTREQPDVGTNATVEL